MSDVPPTPATVPVNVPATPPGSTVGVVTIAANRRRQLEAQAVSISRQTMRPDRYVVVDMGGPDAEPMLVRHVNDVVVVESDGSLGQLPLARARNLGRAVADTDITIFLDVDCVATSTLVEDYVRSVTQHPGIHASPVGYLPPDVHGQSEVAVMSRVASYQPGRPRPGETTRRAPGHEMFWSLSFAVDRGSWDRIGGFDERYVGYGGEDTDFARTAVERGVPIWFGGDAGAFHQFHPTASPPVDHLDDICRNATIYHAKWHEWPMSGWLAAFAEASLIDWTPEASSIVIAPHREAVR